MGIERAIGDILEGLNGDELIVSTTGYTSRILFNIKDTPRNFYMLGSMGLALSIGVGLALSQPDKKVVVIDGDGACLMNLGSLATAGYLGLGNLSYYVLDNGAYASTGGQYTIAKKVSLKRVGKAVGLKMRLIKVGREHNGAMGRVNLLPQEVAERFRGCVGGH
jgi:thiamine pyrophosphate-dependent acetolactate synthase large subunit-like protein